MISNITTRKSVSLTNAIIISYYIQHEVIHYERFNTKHAFGTCICPHMQNQRDVPPLLLLVLSTRHSLFDVTTKLLPIELISTATTICPSYQYKHAFVPRPKQTIVVYDLKALLHLELWVHTMAISKEIQTWMQVA